MYPFLSERYHIKAKKHSFPIHIFIYFILFYLLCYNHTYHNVSNIAMIFWVTVHLHNLIAVVLCFQTFPMRMGEEINKAIEDAECWFETRTYTPDTDRNKDTQNISPQIWAVGHYQSSNIWLATCSEAEQVYLASMGHCWPPKLSDWLSIAQKTFPVIVHRILSTFILLLNVYNLFNIKLKIFVFFICWIPHGV